jgi:hypothetical protein
MIAVSDDDVYLVMPWLKRMETSGQAWRASRPSVRAVALNIKHCVKCYVQCQIELDFLNPR